MSKMTNQQTDQPKDWVNDQMMGKLTNQPMPFANNKARANSTQPSAVGLLVAKVGFDMMLQF